MAHCATFLLFTVGRNRSCCLLFLLLAMAASPLGAQQQIVTAGNRYVSVSATSDPESSSGGGRFVIDAGPEHGDYRFLYYITSHVVFRVTAGGGTSYYTNARPEFGGQPTTDGTTPIAYRPFDSIYHSSDTIAFGWHGLAGGFSVTMRLIPEKPLSSYDRGSDVLIEFSYARLENNGPAAQLGIFMMLDCYNGQATGIGGGGDKSSILTSRGYFPTTSPGKIFHSPIDVIPEFYHVGNFRYETPLNTVLPIHRLMGKSHNGAPLTRPELFAIASWRLLRNIGWTVTDAEVGAGTIGDAATALRWSGLEGSGTVRTAFGMNNKEGNDMYHCRDTSLFVDIRSERVLVKTEGDDTYRPNTFDVTMWVTSTTTVSQNVTVLLPAIIGAPTASGRLNLDPSTPGAQTVTLGANETRQLRWRLSVVTGLTDSLTNVPLDFRYQIAGSQARVFKLPCTPVITLRTSDNRLLYDTIAPVIKDNGLSSDPRISNYLLFDRHASFVYDTGIDTIVINENLGGNGTVSISTPGYRRCDTTVNIALRVTQIDSLRPMRVRFTVIDCAGNATSRTVTADAHENRTDTLAPRLLHADSTGREWGLVASDRHLGYAFDTGLDSIRVESSLNFELQRNQFVQCDTTVEPRVTARVVDPARDGFIALVATDCRGNAYRDTIVYRGVSGVATGAGAESGLAIVDIRPQPQAAGRELEIVLRNAYSHELRCELIAMEGGVAAELTIDPTAGSGARAVIRLPEALPAGVYLLRLRGAEGIAQARIVVTE